MTRTVHDKENIPLDAEYQKDLRWFQFFITKLSGVVLFHYQLCCMQVELDASHLYV